MPISKMCTRPFTQVTKARSYFVLNIEFKIVDTTDKTTAPKIAGSHPSIFTPGTTAATINKTTALITKVNNPKVTIVSGALTKLSIGLIKVLITPKTIAAKIAVVKLAT